MPSNSPTPSSRPVAGEEIGEGIPAHVVARITEARKIAKYQQQRFGEVSRTDAVVIWMAEEIARLTREHATRTAALDALRDAVMPVEDAIREQEHRARPAYEVTQYTIEWVNLRPLLNAISALLGGDDD